MPFVEAIYAGGGWVAIWLGRMACNISEGNAAALGGCTYAPVAACDITMPLGAAARIEHVECVACGGHGVHNDNDILASSHMTKHF